MPDINDYTKIPWATLRKLPEREQVRLRFEKVMNKPGHRTFLRAFLEKLWLFADGKISEEQLWAGGWSMGQYDSHGKEIGEVKKA